MREHLKGKVHERVRANKTTARQEPMERKLEIYDATALIGLKTIVFDAAIERVDENGERTIEVPKLDNLLASAAIVRCLAPERLRGSEIRAIRKIMKLTLSDLAKKLDSRAAPETVSRWESEAQPMGAYAEKVLRLVVCEELKNCTPGITYNASIIAGLEIADPWRNMPDYEMPPIELIFGRLKELSGKVVEAWDTKLAA